MLSNENESDETNYQFGGRKVFLSIAVAAVTGGTVHGFFLDEGSTGYRILWSFTLIVMGTTGLSGVHIGTALQFSNGQESI